jgi:protein arginine kinase activator
MICQNCLKNQSNYHFTKIINGNKTEYHLCEACAREKGDIVQGPGNSFSIHNLLSGMLNIEFGPNTSKLRATETRCDTCGMTFNQFSKKGRFGCADCYDAFGTQLEPVIRRVQQNNTVHGGKSPHPRTIETDTKPDFAAQLSALEEELQSEIRNERYERAAVLRDRINVLKQQMGSSAIGSPTGNITFKKWPHFKSEEGE